MSCIPKSCGVPPSLANTLHISVERHYLDSVTYICKSGYSVNGLRYGKKEFLLGCKSDSTLPGGGKKETIHGQSVPRD